MDKKTVGVFFGSRSAEHDISIVTALSAIMKPLERSGQYHVVLVYIAKDGRWFSDEKLKDMTLYSSDRIANFMARTQPVGVLFDGGLTLLKPGLRNQKIKIDIAFPATHGTYGEDGSLMGLLRMANVPFVGADLAASAIAMDKVLAKQVAESARIPVPRWTWCISDRLETERKQIMKRIAELRYPLFVKPAHLGSSIGISKVTKQTELANALELAGHYDDKIIIEEGVQNLIEVTIPIMGNDALRLGMVERPLSLTNQGVFDFETKYMNQGKGGKAANGKQGAQGYSEIPAKISDNLTKQAQAIAIATYRAVGCTGLSRIDLLIDEKANQVYFNEINPLPGSLYLHNWRAAGLSPVDVVRELIRFAEERHSAQQKLTTTFATNFLKQF